MRGFAELYFLRDDISYNRDIFRTINWDPEWYIRMLMYPADEMLSNTPGGFAGELMARTTSLQWHSQLRRVVRPGDTFTFDAQHWLYIPASDTAAFADYHVTYIDAWPVPHLRITQLTQEHEYYDQFDRCDVPLHHDRV